MKQDMIIACPHCSARFMLAEGITELEQKEIADIAAEFGKSWRLIYEYTDCFRRSETGGMKRSKRVRLLKEIKRLFNKCEFDYKGKLYRTAWPDVIGAITEICNREKCGLENHNYLKVILLKKSERVSAEGLTAAEEEEREQARRRAGKKESRGEREQGRVTMQAGSPVVREKFENILKQLDEGLKS